MPEENKDVVAEQPATETMEATTQDDATLRGGEQNCCTKCGADCIEDCIGTCIYKKDGQ